MCHVSESANFPINYCVEGLDNTNYWIEIDKNFINYLSEGRNDVLDQQSGDTGFSQKLKYKRKRKRLEKIEDEIQAYKKNKSGDTSGMSDLKDRLLTLDLDISTKSMLLDKYYNTKKLSGSEYAKAINWLNTATSLPFGKIKNMGVTKEDSPEKIKAFLKSIQSKLDENICGLEYAKREILEYVARKISNPEGKGCVLALCGAPGVGKTKLLKSLSSALDLPLFQINCGGLNDVAVLTGHSETYVGAKPGKIVESLQTSECMNCIFYFDEVDKISEQKSRELFGVLTHLFDEEQNDKFQDNFLSNISINLSKCMFVVSFNDLEKVDSIVSDRMKIIYINTPTLDDKIQICQEKMLPEILKSMNFSSDYTFEFSTELIAHVIQRNSNEESGMRGVKKLFEKIVSSVNYDILIGEIGKVKIEKLDTGTKFIVTKKYVDDIIPNSSVNESYMHMYI